MIAEQTRINFTTFDEDWLWRGLTERDLDVEGKVFYAIRSTGIFCRPGCPARRPNRVNVRYFPTVIAARRAGYRACKRCRPTEDVRNARVAFVERACRDIDRHLDGDVTLDAIAARLGCSPFHLQRVFRQVSGVTPRAYTVQQRMERLKQGLRNGRSVTAAHYDAGFTSGSQLYAGPGEELGMTPRAYREAGAGLAIAFTVRETALGAMLVAATARGICAVRLGDAAAALEASLRTEYHAAAVTPGGAALDSAVDRILDHLAGRGPHLDLPLDIQETAFQRQVWEALRRIPVGETRSYAEVARSIGAPTASRAVAGACAANPVALLIPCHRAVRTDGGLGGYRWGVDRKARLLAMERTAAEA